MLVAILAALALAGPLAGSSQALSLATSINLQLSKSLIAADGISTTIATATVTDGTSGVANDNVTFTPSAGSVGVTTDNHDGTYTATITSASTPSPSGNPVTVTATDSSPIFPITSNTANLTEYGPASSFSVGLSPDSIRADGVSSSIATATVADAVGNPVPVDTVIFSSSDTGDQIGATNPVGDGTYTAQVTSSRQAGAATITATDTSPSTPLAGSSTLMQTAGPAAQMSVTVNPAKIPADGSSSSTATATVTDANGNPVSGETVNFSSSDQNQTIGPTSYFPRKNSRGGD